MFLDSGTGLSVRGLTTAGFTALALLCLAVAAGAGWLGAMLQNTGAQLTRDAASLGVATEIELQLLNYQRLASLAEDPAAQSEAQLSERDLHRTMRDALELDASPADRVLIERAVADAGAYLARRAELAAEGLPMPDVLREARPLLSDALASLRLLREAGGSEVAAGYERAQRVGAFFINAALGTAILAGAVLLFMILAVRRLLIRPILALRDTIERYRAGDLHARADERSPRELREIARAFNEMSAQLGRQRASQVAFIAGVAHDLRNPLTALRYSVDAIERGREQWAPETAKLIDTLDRQLEHLARMVDDLLETASVEAGELMLTPGVFDLRDAVREVVRLYESVAADRTVEVDLGVEPALIDADRTRIEQVVGNLLNNAIKFTARGGWIRVEAARHGNVVELAIADDGVGIDAKHSDDIFRPFWRRAPAGDRGGSGLGLSVVRRIVAAHGGTVAVESSPGSGSRFVVRLPAADAAEPSGSAA